jgi:hypothetical protein
MKVWLAFDIFTYEYEQCLGVFTDKEKAVAACFKSGGDSTTFLEEDIHYHKVVEVNIDQYYQHGVLA